MRTLALVVLLAFTGVSPWASAAKDKGTKTTKMEWTAEQPENMAKMHENMASCLRSTKTI